jgi:hypothetical protein
MIFLRFKSGRVEIVGVLRDALNLYSLFLNGHRVATSVGVVVAGDHGLVHADGLIVQLDRLQYLPLH